MLACSLKYITLFSTNFSLIYSCILNIGLKTINFLEWLDWKLEIWMMQSSWIVFEFEIKSSPFLWEIFFILFNVDNIINIIRNNAICLGGQVNRQILLSDRLNVFKIIAFYSSTSSWWQKNNHFSVILRTFIHPKVSKFK